MGKTDVWMPLYVSDYLRKTMHLSTVEHGAYLLLIMHAWTNDGMIPSDDAQLARITRMPLAQWRKIKAEVLSFWTMPGGAGAPIYMHDRIEEELKRSREVSEKRRKAGANGAAKRWQDDSKCYGDAIDLPVADASQIDRQSQSHNSPSESKRARGAALPDGLIDKVWSSAPQKARERSSRADTTKALAAAIKRGGDPDEIVASLNRYWQSPDASKDGGAYAKGVHRMIAEDRWREWSTGQAAKSESDDAETDADWRRRLSWWQADRSWIEAMYGPRPGEPGCRVPKHLLEEGAA
ncbi:MAG TPA: DUF1376 domain-containing protein [Brevundimonas sp.]|jgi:uncharacterized protein YdaU (DUF1376 family)|uniref:YdaU family protein n=1 Tax=Brevundimonas sp. TaxID=1871086 RepID=UPI002E166CC3|nr:DUF1376 domain-containing protein [Brevundimonas sp.]